MDQKEKLSGFVIATSLLLCGFSGRAQETIEGFWYSSDSTRIYQVSSTDSGYTAILFSSKRRNDQPGAIVMTNVVFTKKSQSYQGFIHAVDDGLTTRVQIRPQQRSLVLKLRRMFIMPVTIKWFQLGIVPDPGLKPSFNRGN